MCAGASRSAIERCIASTLHFDDLILGSGEAGKYLAWTLAKVGLGFTAIFHKGQSPCPTKSRTTCRLS